MHCWGQIALEPYSRGAYESGAIKLEICGGAAEQKHAKQIVLVRL